MSDVEEVEADVPLQLEEDQVRREWWQCEDQRERDGEHREDEQRHAVEGHPRRAQLEDGDDEVQRSRGRRQAVEDESERVEVGIQPGVVLLGVERRVAEPATVRGLAEQHSDVKEEARTEEEPVAQRVETRECEIARAKHQRQEVVPECADRHRDDEEEDHRHPVHRHRLVEGLRRQHRSVRPGQLSADQQRLDTARAEEHERGEEVEQADPLVIDRRQPAEQSGTFLPDQTQPLRTPACERWQDLDGHFSSSR